MVTKCHNQFLENDGFCCACGKNHWKERRNAMNVEVRDDEVALTKQFERAAATAIRRDMRSTVGEFCDDGVVDIEGLARGIAEKWDLLLYDTTPSPLVTWAREIARHYSGLVKAGLGFMWDDS